MMNRRASHLNSCLTTFTLALLTLPDICPAEDLQAAPHSNGIVNVDARLLSGLLTPMSHLIHSPYSDRRATENPLGSATTASVSSIVHYATYESHGSYTSYEDFPVELGVSSPMDLHAATASLIGLAH